jgi:hypothetical protein
MSTHHETEPTVAATTRYVPTPEQKQAAADDIRAAFREQARAERRAPSFDELCDAIDRLNQSERGRACLKRFNSMLQAYGFGLDTGNWQALATLHRAGAAGQQRMILQIQEAR